MGDPSPMGGTLGAVGPGTLNNHRQIVFLAENHGSDFGHAFMWDSGVVTKYVATGDPVPGGGTFYRIGTERVGFADGTSMPVGDIPGINDTAQVSFFGMTSGAIAERGLFLSYRGNHDSLVKTPVDVGVAARNVLVC